MQRISGGIYNRLFTKILNCLYFSLILLSLFFLLRFREPFYHSSVQIISIRFKGVANGVRRANYLITKDKRRIYRGGKNTVEVQAGEILQILTPGGGGGWGSSLLLFCPENYFHGKFDHQVQFAVVMSNVENLNNKLYDNTWVVFLWLNKQINGMKFYLQFWFVHFELQMFNFRKKWSTWYYAACMYATLFCLELCSNLSRYA